MNSQAMPSQGQQMYHYPMGAYNGQMYSGGQFYDGQMTAGHQAHQMFNPQSQSFVPKPATNPYQQMQHGPSGYDRGNAAGYLGLTSFQQQNANASHFSQMSGYSSPQFPQNTSAPKRPQTQSSNTPTSQGPRQQQTSQSSIAKWGTPATLPAKPPPPVTSLPFQVPKEFQQPLPPHPFQAVGRVSANGAR